METFDAIAGSLGLRLVESGRGRGRPARPPRGPAVAPELAEDEDMVEVVPGPMEPGEETHRKFDKFDTHPGPGALHCLTRSDAPPDVSPVPAGTTAAATGDDATPSDAGPGAAPAPDENSTNSTPGEADSRVDGAKRPVGDVVECPADAIGPMVMDDDGAPPAPADRGPDRVPDLTCATVAQVAAAGTGR